VRYVFPVSVEKQIERPEKLLDHVGGKHRGRLRQTDFEKKSRIRREVERYERVFENDEGSRRAQDETQIVRNKLIILCNLTRHFRRGEKIFFKTKMAFTRITKIRFPAYPNREFFGFFFNP